MSEYSIRQTKPSTDDTARTPPPHIVHILLGALLLVGGLLTKRDIDRATDRD